MNKLIEISDIMMALTCLVLGMYLLFKGDTTLGIISLAASRGIILARIK